MPGLSDEQAPVPPISYHHREVQTQAQCARALRINALDLDRNLASAGVVPLGCADGASALSAPLPKGAGGRPRRYREELLLLAYPFDRTVLWVPVRSAHAACWEYNLAL